MTTTQRPTALSAISHWFTTGELTDTAMVIALQQYLDAVLQDPHGAGSFREIDSVAVVGARSRLGLNENCCAGLVLETMGMKGWTRAHVAAHILDAVLPGKGHKSRLVDVHSEESLIDPESFDEEAADER